MRDDDRTESARGGNQAIPRERTLLGTGAPVHQKKKRLVQIAGVPERREKTVLGIGPRDAIAARAPAREASQQEPPPEGWDLPEPATRPRHEAEAASAGPIDGIGAAVSDGGRRAPREPSIAVDLSELDPTASNHRIPKASAQEPSIAPAGVPRRRGYAWLMTLVVGALVIAFGYEQRVALQPLARTWGQRLMGTQTMATLRALPVWGAAPTPSAATISPAALAGEPPTVLVPPVAAGTAKTIASAAASTASEGAVTATNASSSPSRPASREAPPPAASPPHPNAAGDNAGR